MSHPRTWPWPSPPMLMPYLVTCELPNGEGEFTWPIRATTALHAKVRCWNALVRKGMKAKIVKVEADR